MELNPSEIERRRREVEAMVSPVMDQADPMGQSIKAEASRRIQTAIAQGKPVRSSGSESLSPSEPVTAASRAGQPTFDDRSDLSRDAENSFYGGGAAPIPTPTPTPAPQSMDTSNLIFNPNAPEPRNPNAFAFFDNSTKKPSGFGSSKERSLASSGLPSGNVAYDIFNGMTPSLGKINKAPLRQQVVAAAQGLRTGNPILDEIAGYG